ncbi:MAG: hypothetical protein Q4G16_00375 [Cruoricaptor ignavus]|nr:hypothetical protein [Cruoricaptor ignavus]
MKKIFTLLYIYVATLVSAQYISLSKAEHFNENNDKRFYNIASDTEKAEYLGEIEVQGFSKDDATVFNEIYKKAKTIGANAYTIKQQETIDGGLQKFNPEHYYINLYYKEDIGLSENKVYFFSSARKSLKIKINNQPYIIEPRSYSELILNPGEIVTVSSGGFLGTKLVLGYKENQPTQYFQVLSGGVRADQSGSQGGLNIKSGDFVKLENSYAQFLMAVYDRKND